MMKKSNLCASGMAPAKLRLSPSIVPTLRNPSQYVISSLGYYTAQFLSNSWASRSYLATIPSLP
jgi:hypothetical protein